MCPSDAVVAAFVDRTLDATERDEVEQHVYACESCRAAIAHVVAANDGPRELGRYRLERELGRGGMGVVWDAWDPLLERRIAIKLLHAQGSVLDEARTLAKLQHPNVVAIYDVGEQFIATELIDGASMASWQPGKPAREIIAAYAQAARGLRAVHALGLVHRDVKPSNIFVGRDGRVRVGDFGLAAFAGDGDVAGTPAYMAPEQRAGKPIDARADQYSLCLALAEALRGERLAPDAQLPSERPWPAIARGLRADPDERFADLDPLIAALEHRRARRWPWALALVPLLYFVLRPAGSDCTSHALTYDPAQLRTAFAAVQQPYAADAAATTIAALDAYAAQFAGEDREACGTPRREACLARVGEQFTALIGELGHPDAAVIQRAAASVRGLPEPSLCSTAGGLADQVVPGDAARMQALSAKVAHAAALRRLGKLPEAKQAATAALAEAQGLPPAVAEAQHELGTILHAGGDPGAEAMLVAALTSAATAHADLSAARISALLVEVVGEHGDLAAAERQAQLARPAIIRAGTDRYLEGVVERGLGYTAMEAKQPEVALAHYQKAEALHRGEPDDVDFDRSAMVTELARLERIDEAAALNTALLASDREHLGAKHPRTIQDLTKAGQLLFLAGRYVEAAPLLEQAVALDDEVSGKDSVHAARTRAKLGAAYLQLGRLAEAEPLFRASVAALPATDDERTGQQMNLAAIQIVLGHYAEAEAALEVLAASQTDDQMLGLVLQNLGDAYTRDGKPDRGLATALRAIAHDAKNPRMEAEARVSVGNALLAQGKRAPAIAEYQKAIAMFEKAVGPNTAELGEPLTALGELTDDQAMLARAVKLLAAGDPVDLARARFALGKLRDDRAEVEAADKLLAAAGDRAKARRALVQAWLHR